MVKVAVDSGQGYLGVNFSGPRVYFTEWDAVSVIRALLEQSETVISRTEGAIWEGIRVI